MRRFYTYIILPLFLASFVFPYVNNETGWEYIQGTQQCFYIFERIHIDGVDAIGDGQSANNYYGDCMNNPYTCDVIGAFVQRDETDFGEDLNNDGQITSSADVCIGWIYASSDGFTTVPLIGAVPGEDDLLGYIEDDEIPILKIYDHNNDVILPLHIDNIYYNEFDQDLNQNGVWNETVYGELLGWGYNEIFMYSGSLDAYNGLGCNDQSACNYDDQAIIDDGSCIYPEDNYDCNGNCINYDCSGECGGTAVIDDCGDCWIYNDINPAPGVVQNLSYESSLYYIELNFNEGVADDVDGFAGALNNSSYYLIYRDGDQIARIDDLCNDEFNFIDNNLPASTSYTYEIVPYNAFDVPGEGTSIIASTLGVPLLTILSPTLNDIYSTVSATQITYSTSQPDLISHIEAYYLNQDDVWVLLSYSNEINGSIEVLFPDIDEEVYYGAMVLLVAYDVGDYYGANQQSTTFLSESFMIANDTQSIELSQGWHMVGVPLELYNTNSEMLFPSTYGWTIFASDGLFSNVEIDFSAGYYLAIQDSITLTAHGSPVTTDNIVNADIALSKGWNLISHTLMKEISKYSIIVNYQGSDHDWYDATSHGYLSPTMYRWNQNRYEIALELEPWGAYWLHTSNNNVTLKIRPDSEQNSRISSNDIDKIILKIDDLSEVASSDEIVLGISELASDEFIYGEDEYNLESFVNPNYLDIYFVKNDWIGIEDLNGVVSETPNFSRIYSSNSETLKTYSIKTSHSGVENLVNLTWDISSNIETDIHMIIKDEIYNLRDINLLESRVSDLENITLVVGNIDEHIIPDEFAIGPPYPNPFNPTTSINLAITEDTHVKAVVYSINGQIVDVISNNYMLAGKHTLVWNASNHASGIYILRVHAQNNTSSHKLILMK